MGAIPPEEEREDLLSKFETKGGREEKGGGKEGSAWFAAM